MAWLTDQMMGDPSDETVAELRGKSVATTWDEVRALLVPTYVQEVPATDVVHGDGLDLGHPLTQRGHPLRYHVELTDLTTQEVTGTSFLAPLS